MFKKFLSVALISSVSLAFVACSDDDDDPVVPGSTITEVFPEGTPANVGGAKITTNAQGQVTAVVNGTETVSFSYEPITRATTFDVTMTIKDVNYPDETAVYYLKLNKQGYVEYALEVETYETESEEQEWWFTYNNAGQLNYMKRTEGGGENGFEICNITYADGDITKVVNTEERTDGNTGDDGSEYTISYVSGDVKTAIANKGAIMLFDDCFGIDMDDMANAYYAGLLGKATKNLPVKRAYSPDDYCTFAWTLNSNGLPTKMTELDYGSSWVSDPYDITFEW